MAKAKSGGTRSFLRGRVGSDVYSIGKDAKGNKQQIVRSLAESVANPQTLAQMRGRMIMSTIMQAVSSMSAISAFCSASMRFLSLRGASAMSCLASAFCF